MGKEDEILTQRLAGMDDAAAAWRETLAAAEPVPHELPELPRTPEPPIQARVAVETLRRERDRIQTRLSSVRAERDTLAAQDADTLRARPRRRRARAPRRSSGSPPPRRRSRRGSAARSAASAAERAATDEEAEVNRLWREASTELERLRETYEDEDRARGDLERRIRDAERVLREGHQREPEDAMTELSEDDTVPGLERKAELVQRRLGLLGRVNLLAGRRVRGAAGAPRLPAPRARGRPQGAPGPARGDPADRDRDRDDVRGRVPGRGRRVRAPDRRAVPRRRGPARRPPSPATRSRPGSRSRRARAASA